MTTQDILNEMQKLGDTPDAIAAALLKAGCNGVMGSHDNCPLVHWAGSVLHEEVIIVDDIDGPPYKLIGNNDSCMLTARLQTFAEKFDSCDYPELVRGQSGKPFAIIDTASGFGVVRPDGEMAEFLDSAEAAEVCRRLNAGEDTGDYEWQIID